MEVVSLLWVAIKEYQKILLLTEAEIDALPKCIQIKQAIEVLNSSYYIAGNLDKDSLKEMNYWLQRGRLGLRQLKEDR